MLADLLSRGVECSLDPMHATQVSLCQLTLPQSQYAPPISPERARDRTIALLVLLNLLSPCPGVRFWADVAAAVVAVPEASIDEDGHLACGPHEIRSPWQGLMPSPSGQPSFPK